MKSEISGFNEAFYNTQGGLYCWPIEKVEAHFTKRFYNREINGLILKGVTIDYLLSVKWEMESEVEEFTIHNEKDFAFIKWKVEQLNRVLAIADNIAPNQHHTFFFNDNFIVVVNEKNIDPNHLQLLENNAFRAELIDGNIYYGDNNERFYIIYEDMPLKENDIFSIKHIMMNFSTDIKNGYKKHYSRYISALSDIMNELDSQH